MEKSSLPSWLLRALNPNTPMTDDNETMKTIDVEIDGKIYLVPTIRMNDKGELYKLTDKEAVDKAKESEQDVSEEKDEASVSES